MPRALSADRTIPYVLKDDRTLPDDLQTTFQLEPLSIRDYERLQDRIAFIEKKQTNIRSGSYDLDAVRIGLKGWERFWDGDPEEFENPADCPTVPFETRNGGGQYQNRKVVTDECLERLAPKHRAELARVILREVEVDEETAQPS